MKACPKHNWWKLKICRCLQKATISVLSAADVLKRKTAADDLKKNPICNRVFSVGKKIWNRFFLSLFWTGAIGAVVYFYWTSAQLLEYWAVKNINRYTGFTSS